MKKLFLSGILLINLIHVSAQACVDSSLIDLSAICPLVFIPTCGCDSVLYNNPCEAIHYGGVTSYHIGYCGADSNCHAAFNLTTNLDTASFINLSTSSDSITWYHYDFGDGDTSNVANPMHLYPATHDTSFITCLSIYTNSACTNQFCQYFKILANTSDSCFANFTFVDSFETVHFTDSSYHHPLANVFYNWNFDDGFTDSVKNPTHVYTTPGMHLPCLTITSIFAGDTCIHAFCIPVSTSSRPCINPLIIDSTKYCPNVNPVCGCDSVTYTNQCMAQYYKGVISWRNGPCYTAIDYNNPENLKFTLSPNPAQDKLTLITNSNSTIAVEIYNLQGELMQQTFVKALQTIDISYLQDGLYFVKLIDNKQFRFSKLVKN